MRKPWIVAVALAAISSLGVTSFYLLQTERMVGIAVNMSHK